MTIHSTSLAPLCSAFFSFFFISISPSSHFFSFISTFKFKLHTALLLPPFLPLSSFAWPNYMSTAILISFAIILLQVPMENGGDATKGRDETAWILVWFSYYFFTMYSSVIVLILQNKVPVLRSVRGNIHHKSGWPTPRRRWIRSKEWLAAWLGFPDAK